MYSVSKKIKQLLFPNKFPVFIQTDRFDCGPTCLRMLAKFYGKNLSMEHLRYKCKIGPDGVSAKNLIAAGEDLGFHIIPALIDFETLAVEAPLPCIVYWRDRHFVIVHKIKRNKVYVADPIYGLITYTKEEFVKAWQNNNRVDDSQGGMTILLEPTAKFYEQEDDKKPSGLNIILPYLNSHKKYLIQVFIGVFIGMIVQLIIPFVTQALVDKGINYGDLNFVYVLLLAQLVLFLSSSFLNIIRSWLLLYIGSRTSMLVTSDYLTKLLKKPVSFFDSKTPGDILQRINESKRLEDFLNEAPWQIFSYINALIFLVILAYYSLLILGIFIVGIIAYVWWVWFFMKKREELDFKRFDASSNINSTLIQTVNGIQEVKVNGAETRHTWSWEKNRVRYYKTAISTLKVGLFQSIGGDIINQLKNISITFAAALLVIQGQITLGTMLAIQYIVGQVNVPLWNLVGFFRLVQDAKLSVERFGEIDFINPEEKLLNEQNLLTLPKEAQDIVLENVNFSYEGDMGNLVLKDINLHIPKGKTTAIVGNSGGGKTTLIKLLLKLYLPTEGALRIGNTNLNHIDTNNWRALCGTVLQEGYIFSDNVTNNITESAPNDVINTDRLLEAVRVANIEELINSLPSGFNSMIGPAGSSGRTLSGGQRQRLLIARAVYKNPEFLFFDEATSALDANNERTIIDNLDEFCKGKTVVVIAHRLSTVKNADQIVVLDQGTIKEVGTHDELIDKRGSYYQLIKNQLELGN
ncbi:peptidase domain-containing ABC transporter [Aureispira anguillae]|uniref:Peptidase domain-containing ABC transporter n=1 Tax=Aureispira anguillae TaxID=2864201 RepID=A0A916DTX4_9BACT|nr:peptidase domain-containing ABC transporter [Aureispira anguillae]BDS13644.1 peptidase domain-containing ABC transporter [Aureispira anguillae]